MLTWGDGWTAGGAPAAQSAPYATKVRDAWSGAGRSGEPRIASLAYFSLGEDAEGASREYLLHYYGFLGDYGPMIANGALRSVSQVTDAVKAFETPALPSCISTRRWPSSTRSTGSLTRFSKALPATTPGLR
jgi:alkanesulfonate monooxygenase SsuD/methylene tetrahydromethanopterin reductase-like flavin-dependent oxidoreductase (luciferase family)